MELSQIMTREVEVIAPSATLQEAAEQMKARDVGALPVCEGPQLVGMLTDRDITVRADAAGLDPQVARVRDVLTPHVHYCFEDQAPEEAAWLMKEYRIRRLAILDRGQRLVGMVSLDDLALTDESLAGEVLRGVVE